MTAELNRVFSDSLVDEWARAGVRTAAVAPGSRSAPLALALAADSRIELQVFLDERSAAFFALGAAKASGWPAIVLCTSGTAAANLHPAVIEAHHSRAPLLVCTADRPPELRDTGAGQAVDQVKLYGSSVRWFADVGVPEDLPHSQSYWRSTAARAVSAANGPPAGPVHMNLAYREPLVDAHPSPATGPPGSHEGSPPWVRTRARRPAPDTQDVEYLSRLVASTSRGVLVAGWGADVPADVVEAFASAAGWPVLADPISGTRTGRHSISTYDALLRVGGFRLDHQPELAVQIGAPLTGRTGAGWLDPGVRRVLVDPDNAWLDPQRAPAERFVADPAHLLEAVTARLVSAGPSPWLDRWLVAETIARSTIDDLLDSWPEPFEGRVARDVVDCLPAGSTLVVGSSLPVRDVESFARPRSGIDYVSNRGASGIDGMVSTVLGVSSAVAGPVVALLGDLTFLHDAGGLLAASERGLDAAFVVLDNDGGGVFSFLPQAADPDHFETLFGTPHNTDLVALARLHRLSARRLKKSDDVGPAVVDAVNRRGLHVVVIPTERTDNVARHRKIWDAVSEALRAAGITGGG